MYYIQHNAVANHKEKSQMKIYMKSILEGLF